MDKTLEKILTKWLKQQKQACGIYLKLAISFGVLSGMALVAQAYCIATVLHGVIIAKQPVAQFTLPLVSLLVLIGVRALLAYGRERVSFEAGRRLRQQMRANVLDKLTRMGPGFIQGKPAGSWASIVLEQVEDLQDFYARYLPQIALAGFIPLIILVAVFPMNWAGGIILLATAPLIPLFMILVGMGAADANRKNFSALAKLSGHFMDRLQGLATLKRFYRAESEIKQISKASEEFRERTMSVLRLAFLSSAVLEFFAAVSIAVLAVYFGFSYLGHLDFGHYGAPISLFTGLFVLILAPEFYQPLRDMGTHYHAKAQAIGAAEELMKLLDAPEPNMQGQQPLTADISIEAHELTVFSHDGCQLLGPISFRVCAGQHLAIVGPSGAGKTSLLQALLGFLPYQGSLKIGGIELQQLDLVSWRQKLAWLGQEPQLFHGSIRDNICLNGNDLTDEQVLQLLKQAHIADWVESLTQGLNYQLTEQTQGLSVGQAQRIALARAFAQQASCYVLDEPTASLDSISEQLVLQSLAVATADKTCVMVTHRLDQLQQIEQIIVLDKGIIVEQGSFLQLANGNGVFAQMQYESSQSVTDLNLGAE